MEPPVSQPQPVQGQVADAVKGNWVDHAAPDWARPWLRLSRVDRPIGTWLLLLPCWWGLLLAAASAQRPPDWGLMAWIAAGCSVGAVLMWGAGCTWNDLTDREFDAAVARTASRPLPSGQATPKGAVVWMCAQALLAFGILLTFHPVAIALGVLSLLPVAVYPFAKRFTWWPQAFLGIAFNWGALLAWAAYAGQVPAASVLLYLSGVAWTLFYDTIYAYQDIEDDALIGVRSTARRFGERPGPWMRTFLALACVLMAAAVALALSHRPPALAVAFAGVAAFGGHLLWQIARFTPRDPAACLRLFRTNRDAGFLPLPFFAVAAML
jgi:4-hydroxybenzoate polyprenyltransferase